MRFTLIYDGELRANARPDHKHKIRQSFHWQLKTLWQQAPLSENRCWFKEAGRKSEVDLKRQVGSFHFVPLVSPDLYLVCDLQIFMLRPEAPGEIVKGGDIDNHLKTLFDALRMPSNANELPNNIDEDEIEDPFFCLLEDDALITSVSVKTDRLLTQVDHQSQVHLDIQVETHHTRMMTAREDGKGYEITGGSVLS